MYEKDKNNRITLRLNDRQFNYVKKNAEMLDVSPSDFLRIVINTSMVMFDTKEAEAQTSQLQQSVATVSKLYVEQHPDRVAEAEAYITQTQEGNGRENDKANKHDFV